MADFDTAFGSLAGDVKASPDYVFNAAAWPNNTTKDSSTFQFGGAQGAVELVAVNSGSAATGALTMTLYMGDTEADAAAGSTSGTTATILSAGTGASWALGDELARFDARSTDGMYATLRLTTTADKSSEKITVYLKKIDR